MFRHALPAIVSGVVACAAAAEELRLPGMSCETPPKLDLPEGDGTSGPGFCARVPACVGVRGLWFDGQARGWDEGVVVGRTSAGVPCAGHWVSGSAFGMGCAEMQCRDGTDIDVVYYSQDPDTGTLFGRGTDSMGRAIRV